MNETSRGELPVAIRGGDILVRVNDMSEGGAGGELWTRLITFSRLRGEVAQIEGAEAVSLRALAPYVQFKFDEADLSLSMNLDPRLLSGTVVALQSGRPRDLIYSRDTSTFLNYSVGSFGRIKETTLFAETGTSFKGNLLYNSATRDTDGHIVRTLSSFTIDDRERLRRWTMGDAAISADALGGSALIGGISFTRAYQLDPYFVRYPSLNLRGIALTPSTVDVYVNGVRVGRQQIMPGPFELANVPVTSGAGNAQLVIRDAFGNERVESTSFYYSTGVLARGLSEYSYSAGFLRKNFGTRSFDYGDPVVQAYHRHGITETLTAGGRAEWTRGVWDAGPTVSAHTVLGDTDLGYGISDDHGRRGSAYLFSQRYLARFASFGFGIRKAQRDYATISQNTTISSTASAGRLLGDRSAFIAVPLPRGSVSLQWSRSEYSDAPRSQQYTLQGNLLLSSRASLFVAGGFAESAGKRDPQYSVGISVYAGHNSTATASAQKSGGRSSAGIEVQKTIPVGTGAGYRLQLNTREDGERFGAGSLQYQTSFGRYDLTFDPFAFRQNRSLTISGGIVHERGRTFLTRPVQDSFALVRVPDVPNVRVYMNNQIIGRTDAKGDVLLPNLLSYYGNQIRIEDKDIPLNYDVQNVERMIAPPYRGGALVEFPVRRVQTVSGTVLVRAANTELVPAYGELTLHSHQDKRVVVSPVGNHGEFYFEELPPGSYTAVIEYSKGTCSFDISVPPSKEPFLKLGRLTCSAKEGSKP